ncbi:capsid assembly scaffolding protein Gp46 family protein [Clostridium butyricum]
MLKSELIKRLENIVEDADVDEAIKAMDEYKATIDYSKLTTDEYKKILEENPVIKAYQQSQFDSAVGSAVTKYDQKFMKEKFPELLKAEMEKANNKNKTPEQIEAEKTLEEAKKLKAELAHEKNLNKYSKILTDKKLPVELAEFVVGADDETSDKNVEFFNNLFGKMKDQELKDNAPKPPAEIAGKVDTDTQALMRVMGISDDSATTE